MEHRLLAHLGGQQMQEQADVVGSASGPDDEAKERFCPAQKVRTINDPGHPLKEAPQKAIICA